MGESAILFAHECPSSCSFFSGLFGTGRDVGLQLCTARPVVGTATAWRLWWPCAEPKWICWTPTDAPPSFTPSRSVTPIAPNFCSTVEPIPITRTKRDARMLHGRHPQNQFQSFLTFFFFCLMSILIGNQSGVLRCHQGADGNVAAAGPASSGSLAEEHQRRRATARSRRLRP